MIDVRNETTCVQPVRDVLVRSLGENAGHDELLRLATTHGVLPLLARESEATVTDQGSRELLWHLTAHALQNQERNRLLKAEYLELLNLFHHNGIPVIPVKGVWLAETTYGDVSLRSFTDLDFVVRESDLDRCKRSMLSAGYESKYPLSDASERFTRGTRYEAPYVRRAPNGQTILAELQFRFGPDHLALNIEEDQVWSRAEPVSIHGIPALRMSTEDTLLYLCTHSWKHGWCRLLWLCDIAQYIRESGLGNRDSGMGGVSNPKSRIANPESLPINWPVFVSRVKNAHLEPVVIDGLMLASRLANADVPDDVILDLLGKQGATLERDSFRMKAPRFQWCYDARTVPPEFYENTLDEFHHWWPYRPQMVDRLRILLAFVHPTDTDLQAIRLPEPLFFLYYLLRPFLLSRKFLRLLFKKRNTTESRSHHGENL